jgi:DNA-binding response OmpR family regulator
VRILIVDDDRALLALLGAAFRAAGHDVECTERGIGVVARLIGGRGDGLPSPDVCILDNQLPDITGVALLRLAAGIRAAAQVPIVVHSADTSIRALVEGTEHPQAIFVLKGSLSIPELVARAVEHARVTSL